MRILVFGVGNWNTQEEAESIRDDLIEWNNRINAFLGNPKIFIASGTYSDPMFNPLNIDLVQIGLHKKKEYSKKWNYFQVGFLSGLYHSLFNPDWDILIHCQCRTFIGIDMIPLIEEFSKRKEQVCALSWMCTSGKIPETGFLAMKPDAVKKIVTQTTRTPLSENDNEINSEDDLADLFHNNWWNPYPNIMTIRKDGKYNGFDDETKIDMNTFLNLPIVAGTVHCHREELKSWCEKHPIPAPIGRIV